VRRNASGVTLVAVISDTHMPRGARRLPDACLELLVGADAILHAGDVTAASVLDELRELGLLQAVHGNMDEPALRAALPERLVAEVGGVRIGMLHDAGPRAGRAERLATAFPGCDAVVYGHTHLPEATRHDGVWILNPGSPTERRSGPFRSMLVLEVGGAGIEPRLVEL
jgi:putative phosphoesterase